MMNEEYEQNRIRAMDIIAIRAMDIVAKKELKARLRRAEETLAWMAKHLRRSLDFSVTDSGYRYADLAEEARAAAYEFLKAYEDGRDEC